MASLFTAGKFQALNASGALSGALLYTYSAGTTTPLATYTNQGGASPNTNPVVCDSAGQADVWLSSAAYHMVLKTSAGVTVFDTDNIPPPVDSTILADFASASNGAGLIGFAPTLNYAVNTIGWGIKGAGNDYNILTDILPASWAAILNGTTAVDQSTVVQARIDAMAASIGGTIYVPGVILCNTPVVLKSTVMLRGSGELTSAIKKDSTTTKAVTIVAGALVVYTPTTLPSNINAIIVLTDNGTGTGRYNGGISDISLTGTFTTPGNYETQKAEFGVVSIGSVSDSHFQNVTVNSCTYGFLWPTIFASYVQRCKTVTCLSGFSSDNGTSCNFTSNYSLYSRDWGYFIRDTKYCLIAGNACDSTNDPTKYPTRTRECSAYRIRSGVGTMVIGNGDEQTYGNSLYLETIPGSTVTGHVSIGVGSDYTGANQIAWIKSDNAMDMASIYDNHAYDVKASGLTSGGANAANHHNIYAPTATSCLPRRFDNNVVSASRTTMTVEAGWGNNILAAQSGPTTVTAAAYSMICTDEAIIANRAGTVTVTLLPAANCVGKVVTLRTIQAQTVVSASSNVVPLAGGSAGTAICAGTAGKWSRLRSDGVAWQIMEGA